MLDRFLNDQNVKKKLTLDWVDAVSEVPRMFKHTYCINFILMSYSQHKVSDKTVHGCL